MARDRVQGQQQLPAEQLLLLVTEDYPLPGEQLDIAAQQLRVQQACQLWPQQLLVLGLDPYAPAIDTRRIGADLSKILIPGHALWDSRSQHHWGDINGALKRHGSVDLQTAMALLRKELPDVPVSFNNFRD